MRAMNSWPAFRFSVAPMMDLTDRHCRYFHRQMTSHALLYTEMVTTGALIHGEVSRHLQYNPQEHPLALQLGGSDPDDLATCARLAQEWGYDEVNLNCGCPSDRVQNGAFGACLMQEPARVADCVKAMKAVVDIPVTVKCRIGVDDQDSEAALQEFTGQVAEAGCELLIVHARKAWLQGLSPKENREVPPLDYDRVYRLKQTFSDLPMVINGGINDLAEAETHLQFVEGVMLGRSAYYHPAMLLEVDQRIFGDSHPTKSMAQLMADMRDYIEQQLQQGQRVHSVTRHMLGLFQAMPGARQYRRLLSERGVRTDASADLILEAWQCVQNHVISQSPATNP